jgi:hypothetical protein
MEDNVEELRVVLQGCPSGYSDQSLYLSKLALSLYSRFQQRGILSDLDEAIDLDQAALALCPPGHSNRSSSLSNLAIHLYARFDSLSRGVSCLTWMRPLTWIKLHLHSVPLVIPIDHILSTTLQSISMPGFSRGVSCLT